MLRIGPFNYDPIRGVDLWLAQSDDFLLTHLSTSPEVEPPHFANQVRSYHTHTPVSAMPVSWGQCSLNIKWSLINSI